MIDATTAPAEPRPAASGLSDAELTTIAVQAGRMELLSQILRGIGALIIVAAAAVFMLQHWAAGNDLQRYGMLLGFSLLLSGAGIFCGVRLGESKGARTLLALTLAVTPVHFAVLGGLLYSRFALDYPWSHLPGYATWVAPSGASALLATGCALAFLLPLAHLSFLSLARNSARPLSATFFAINLLLLLPVRSPNLIGLLVAAAGAALVTMELRVFSRQTGLHTGEGRLLRLLMTVPVGLLVARTVRFYSVSGLFLAGVFAAVALALFLLPPRLTADPKRQGALQGASTLPTAAAWLVLTGEIVRSGHFGAGWAIPLFVLPLAATLLLMSGYCAGPGTGYRRLAAGVALAGVAANLLLHPGLGAAALCLLAGIAAFAYGYYVEQLLILFAGLGSAAFALIYQVGQAIRLYSLGGWGSLAAIGIGVILAASYLERNHTRLQQKFAQIRQRLQGWEY